jgi:4-azaleucine resistance transporter AzlC
MAEIPATMYQAILEPVYERRRCVQPEGRQTLLGLTLPVGMGYVPAGFAYGVLALQAGLPVWIVVAMSVLVYAGAMQFAAVPMLAGAAGLPTVALTTLAINLRHALYAIPLLDRLPTHRAAKAYVIAALTDETYSVLTTLAQQRCRALGWRIALLNQGYWVLGTLLGVALGRQAARWIPHLDFALPALFVILAIEQYRAQRRWLPAAVGLAAYAVARVTLPHYALLVALGLALVVLLALPGRDARVAPIIEGDIEP